MQTPNAEPVSADTVERGGEQRPEPAADAPPFFRRHVFCCTNLRAPGHSRGCCSEKGSLELRNYRKARVKAQGLDRVRVNVSGCLDRCELGPTMVIYPEGIWYRYESREDLDEILQTDLLGGGRVGRLMLHPEDKTPRR